MSLLSIVYRMGQHTDLAFQSETKDPTKPPKPIFIRQLRSFGGSEGGWGRLRSCFGQVERDELGLVSAAEDSAWKITPQENTSAPEGDAGGEGNRSHDDAEQDDVDQ